MGDILREVSNKERILKLREVFERETDEHHELSFADIIKRLKLEYGADYKVGLRAIKDDIKTLRENEETYLIENTDKFGKKLYSKQNRKFEIYQLRILMDAVYSARFITPAESKRIVEKIKTLTSEGIAKKLGNQTYIDDRIVFEDGGVRYHIDHLHQAIQERVIIRFKYGRYTVHKKFEESNDGNYYNVKPYGLVWNNGFYYLVGYNIEKEKIINYRVDRMRKLYITNQGFSRGYFDLGQHVSQCFNMYPGQVRLIKIKFHNHLINAIIDYFGKDANIEITDDSHFILSAEVAINMGLIRWILNWGSDAVVLYPESLIKDVKIEIGKMYLMYGTYGDSPSIL